ncbi:MAG: helix-turn-helix transcriptional regulator [Eubacterium sp.]|jgi:DNA-binding XRE family transcriptional regulator|nr:helix-turn-helix transcriptional regulator [Eubacterium sp.]
MEEKIKYNKYHKKSKLLDFFEGLTSEILRGLRFLYETWFFLIAGISFINTIFALIKFCINKADNFWKAFSVWGVPLCLVIAIFLYVLLMLVQYLSDIKSAECFYTSWLSSIWRLPYIKYGAPRENFNLKPQIISGDIIRKTWKTLGRDTDKALRKVLSSFCTVAYYASVHRRYANKLIKATNMIYTCKERLIFLHKIYFKKEAKKMYGEELAKQIIVPNEWYSIIFRPKERKERKRINYVVQYDSALTPAERAAIPQRAALMFEFRKLRNEKNITQAELSNMSGLKCKTIFEMENGQWDPRIETILKALAPLGKTLCIEDAKEN